MQRTAYVLAGLVCATVLAGGVAALPADAHVTLEADDGESCTSDQKVDCFRVVNGSLDGLEQGMRVHLKLENVGDNPHNAYVTQGSEADSNNVDTPASAAVNNTETIDAGENTSMMFEVPSDAESLYVWCDVDGHETLGMWLNATVEPAENTTGEDGSGTNGTGDGGMEGSGGDDGDDESTIPAPGTLLLAGSAAAAAIAHRRKR